MIFNNVRILVFLITFLEETCFAQFKPTPCGAGYPHVSGDTCSYQATIDGFSEDGLSNPSYRSPTAFCAAYTSNSCPFVVLPDDNVCSCPSGVLVHVAVDLAAKKIAPGYVGVLDFRRDVYTDGFIWDAQVGWAHPGCPEPALSELVDPVAVSFEAGNRIRPDLLTSTYQTALGCVQSGISAATGSSQLTSAYRPAEYQKHLYEIVTKDKKLNAAYIETFPQCAPIKDQVTAEMSAHGLRSGQQVARPGLSQHEQGKAFDLTPAGVTSTRLTRIFSQCGVTNNAVSNEPWHIQ